MKDQGLILGTGMEFSDRQNNSARIQAQTGLQNRRLQRATDYAPLSNTDT